MGGFCSALISIVVLYYALLKFIQLKERQNPNITTFPVLANYYEDSPLNLNEIDFKIAFSFESKAKQVIDDPRYVKAIVSIESVDVNAHVSETIIPHHKCTEEEYA